MKLQLRRPSPALVVAILALLAATAGTATAAKVLVSSSKQVATGAITSSDLKDRTIRPADLGPELTRALAARGGAGGSATAGPAGATGPAGPRGESGPRGEQGERGPAGTPAPFPVAGGIELDPSTGGADSCVDRVLGTRTITVDRRSNLHVDAMTRYRHVGTSDGVLFDVKLIAGDDDVARLEPSHEGYPTSGVEQLLHRSGVLLRSTGTWAPYVLEPGTTYTLQASARATGGTCGDAVTINGGQMTWLVTPAP